jgi:cell division protein FtsB
MEEVKIEDIWQLVGQLYLDNWRLNKQLPALQAQVNALTEQAKKLKETATVLTVEPKPNETVSEAA